MVLICISLVISNVRYIFIYLLAICTSSLEKCLPDPLPIFKLNCFLVIELYEFFSYFGYYYSFTGYGVLKSPTISVLPSISPFRSVSICFVYLGIPVLGA